MCSQHLATIWTTWKHDAYAFCSGIDHLNHKWYFYKLIAIIVFFLCLFVSSFFVQLWGTTESSWCELHGRSSPSESVTSACQMRASTPARSSPCLSRPPRPFSLFWVSMSVLAQSPHVNYLQLILHILTAEYLHTLNYRLLLFFTTRLLPKNKIT